MYALNFTTLIINRQRILGDVINQLSLIRYDHPIRVIFSEEDAYDKGGPIKEFANQLNLSLLKTGIFTETERGYL